MLRNPVIIEPLHDENIEDLRGVSVKPFQENVAGQPADYLSKAEDGISIHVIKKENKVVGMFRLDLRFHFGHTFAQFDTPGIRTFIIDQDHQGKGLGTEVCRVLPRYLHNEAPRARGLYLLLHVNNAGAYKACTRGGWQDTGEKYTLGIKGMQHIMWMPLQ